jgi:N-acetylglucosaminyl-diphospho-decaprenol L-rhamnosyltransferase
MTSIPENTRAPQSAVLSIVIVNWNTCDLLAQCLSSIEQHPPPDACEVWVVDNASADGSAYMVRERFPGVHLIENRRNVGFAAANNQAIRRSQGRYVLLLNSDTEVQPGALPALVAFMDAQPRAGAAGARLLNADGTLQPSCHPMLTPGREFWRLLFLERLWPRATYPMHRWDRETPRPVEVIKGACLLLRREALDRVGPLDEGYFMYTEEVDFCYRLAQAGWQLWWVPRAEVIHHEAQSSRQAAARMYLQLYRSKVQFYRKFGGRRRAEQFKWLLRLAYWPRLAVAGLGAVFSPSLAAQARTFRRLLAELPGM